MKRTLVTGANGFVGANLVRRLLADGHEVNIICRQDSNTWRLDSIQKEIKVYYQTLEDEQTLSTSLKEIRPDWVFHLAAHGAYSWQNDLKRIISTNILSTANLLMCLANIGCEIFVAAGSSSEYGYKDHAPHEEEYIEPNSEYAIGKAAATHFCRLYAHKYGLRTAVLRLYSIYGPYEDKDRLIPTLIRHGVEKKLPPLVDPDIARDFVYVDDAVDAFIMAASSKAYKAGEVYNVGSGKQTTLSDVVSAAKELFQIAQEPEWGSMPNRKWDTSVWIANVEKIERELGWKTKYSFKEGLSQTIEWCKEQEKCRAV